MNGSPLLIRDVYFAAKIRKIINYQLYNLIFSKTFFSNEYTIPDVIPCQLQPNNLIISPININVNLLLRDIDRLGDGLEYAIVTN